MSQRRTIYEGTRASLRGAQSATWQSLGAMCNGASVIAKATLASLRSGQRPLWQSLGTICLFAISSLLLASCTYKELCYNHPHFATVNIEVDWSKSRYADFDEGTLPTGMTVVAYSRSGSEPVVTSTNDIYHASLRLEKGVYDILLFDYSFIEFGSLEFLSQHSFADICASTVVTKAAWYAKADPDGQVTRNPEWLAAARCEGLEITEDMVNSTRRIAVRAAEAEPTAFVQGDGSLLLMPLSAVRNTKVVVHADGYYNLVSVRAVAGGFARGYLMGQGANTGEKTAYIVTGWEAHGSETDYRKGTVSAVFQTFGFPQGFRAAPEDLTLRLECLLVDGTTIETFNLNVGDIVQTLEIDQDNNIDYLIELYITLPDVKPHDVPNGGFALKVEDWDEEIIAEVPLF